MHIFGVIHNMLKVDKVKLIESMMGDQKSTVTFPVHHWVGWFVLGLTAL